MAVCGINAQLLTTETGYRRAGIHVYLSEVLRNLPNEPELSYKVFSTSRPDGGEGAGKTEWIKTAGVTANPIGRILWEQLVWPLKARQAECDLIHGAAFALPFVTGIPSVVTIFDLSFVHYPEIYPTFRRLYLNRATRAACKKAQKVITISESAKNDLVRLFGVPAEKIAVIYPGLNPHFRRPTQAAIDRFREQNNLPKRFMLHVGTLQPRKNLSLLIDAFYRADIHNVDLVFAGGKGWFFEEIFRKVEQLGLTDRIHFAGYVPDQDLPLWYGAADLLVFPSLYEGFGMPIVEAMGCGTPVLASNASAMPEAVGEIGQLFDPHSGADLANKMQQLLVNQDQLAKMRELGPAHAQRFSWKVAGQKTAEVYQSVLADRN